MTAIAHVGAFSMSNYGDQVYPGVLDALSRQLGIQPPSRHFGLIAGQLPDGRSVEAISSYRPEGLDAAWIGGGDIIRVDRRVVAMDHLCVPTGERGKWINRLRADRFARRAIGNRPGPWMARSWGVPAAYVSAGVHTLPRSPDVLEAITSSSGAWVRTHRGAEILRDAGMSADAVLVGPDAVFALPLVESAADAAERGARILAERTGASDAPVVFHAAAFAGWTRARLASLIEACAPAPCVVLPLGRYAGEHVLLRDAAARARVPFLGVLPAGEVTAVLAAAGCVVSTSMHAAVVAATYGRPVVSPGVAKTATAFEACAEPPPLHQATDEAIPALVNELRLRDTEKVSDANLAAVVETFERIVALVGLR
ncbi:polysaccharide pyruvyl transferase family protein [Aeromicrobium senzhongii]|uniref:Polysaccharide pyruvyl transferase family protein n=1 Tax=Aeromicrobium senzhongii TaxID=2663859 RepID=A0ABX6SUX1_9ACTN|nr:polysaccharide pyruvyl transferase family protein [Aeromicrobium senzhongii]MTB88009.1 hypothetical protein [Aeromicrobium senzhongii]QNL94982.1 polysaccharide pyruvyl transferase family protein [Aeromicrobium senzhongii]